MQPSRLGALILLASAMFAGCSSNPVAPALPKPAAAGADTAMPAPSASGAAKPYARLYPRFQAAYEELGYPRRYFNDRVVDVLDQLITTPDVTAPVKVHRPAINGPVQPQRPWVLYEFDDPALQALSAGQKILVRTGPVNERRLKSRLVELRRLLATGTPAR